MSIQRDIDKEDRANAVTIWSLDYAFVTESDVMLTRKEMETQGMEKVKDTVVVCEDRRTGGLRAHLVVAKGTGDAWVARCIKEDLGDFGYGGAAVRLKSDREPAI